MQQLQRSLTERIMHAVCFEVIAIAICAPTAAWLMDKPLFQMGGLAVLLSTIAMVWNIVYNAGFDKLFPYSKQRGWRLRCCHAFGFEAGFILVGLPLVSWLLGISLYQAFIVEIGFFLFFLPYTFIYNWAYDNLRARILGTAPSH